MEILGNYRCAVASEAQKTAYDEALLRAQQQGTDLSVSSTVSGEVYRQLKAEREMLEKRLAAEKSLSAEESSRLTAVAEAERTARNQLLKEQVVKFGLPAAAVLVFAFMYFRK